MAGFSGKYQLNRFQNKAWFPVRDLEIYMLDKNVKPQKDIKGWSLLIHRG